MEPVSTSGFTALLKLYGVAIMVTLAVGLVAAVVLMTRMPRSPQEWAVGLICTVVSSLAGGSFIIVKWGLHEWVTDVWGDDCSRWVLLCLWFTRLGFSPLDF